MHLCNTGRLGGECTFLRRTASFAAFSFAFCADASSARTDWTSACCHWDNVQARNAQVACTKERYTCPSAQVCMAFRTDVDQVLMQRVPVAVKSRPATSSTSTCLKRLLLGRSGFLDLLRRLPKKVSSDDGTSDFSALSPHSSCRLDVQQKRHI